jgi:hypothetical protein
VTYERFCSRRCQDRSRYQIRNLARSKQREAARALTEKLKPPRKTTTHRGTPIQINNHERRPVVLPGEETRHIKGTFSWPEIDAEYKRICKLLGMPTTEEAGYRPLRQEVTA